MRLASVGKLLNAIDELRQQDITEEQRNSLQRIQNEVEDLFFDDYMEDMGLMGGEQS